MYPDFKLSLSPSIMMFVSPDTLVPDPYNPLDWNRYLYARANPINYNDPSGHWPEFIDYLAGATYQYLDDTSMGAFSALVVDMNYSNNTTFLEGRGAGRVASTVVASVDQVTGAFVAGAGAAGLPATIGGGTVCALATGGACAVPAAGAVAVEAAMVGVGTAGYAYGSGVIAYSKSNPASNPDLFGAKGTQFTSKSLWQGEQGMLHAENPKPGVRVGQIHFQEYGPNGNKWYFDPVNNTFNPIKGGPPAPKWLLNLLEEEKFTAAIDKGLTAL